MIANSWYGEKFWPIDCPLAPTYSLQWMISKFTVLPKGVSRGGGTWFLILGNFIWCYLLFMFSLLHLMLYSLTTCKKILIYDHRHPHSVLFHQLVPSHPLVYHFHRLNLMMESQLCLRHLPCIINLRLRYMETLNHGVYSATNRWGKEDATPKIRNEIVRDLVVSMFSFQQKPIKAFVEQAAQLLVKKYPFLKDVGQNVSGYVNYLSFMFLLSLS